MRLSAGMVPVRAALAFLPVAAFVASAQAQDPSMHPVVDARTGYLLGGSTMGEWMPPDATAGAVEAGAAYRLYADGGAAGTGRGGRVENSLDICPETFLVPFDVPAAAQGRVIAIGGDWNALPRKPKFEKPTPVYRKAMSEWLTARGIADPVVDAVKVVRVDLEGDGTDEVVLAASHRLPRPESAADPRALPGEYSVVLLRRVRDGKVETLELRADVHAAPASEDIPSLFDAAFVLDLNGDGIMEIGIAATYYEGDGIDVFTVEQGDPELILQAGCGA